MLLKRVLDFLYSEECNVTVSSEWDAGWTLGCHGSKVYTDDLDKGAEELLRLWIGKDLERATRWAEFK